MNIDEFKDENNIVDPNVARKAAGTQRISRPAANQPREKRIVTPQEMGFTHEEPKKLKSAEEPILDRMDIAIARKRKEAQLMADAIDEADGEGVSEEEFQDILIQAKDEIEDDGIPEEDNVQSFIQQNHDKEQYKSTLPEQNPANSLMDELDAELEDDEEDYVEEDDAYEDEEVPAESLNEKVVPMKQKSEPTIAKEETQENGLVDEAFKNFSSGDINFDEEIEELEENIDDAALAEKEQQEQMDKLKNAIKEKIKPVTSGFDISSFTISKRPAANNIAVPKSVEKVSSWVLMNSKKPIYMRKFTGTEIERLSEGGKGKTRLNKAIDQWQLIYNHIEDPHKPQTLEQWAKVTSFLDIDHIYMAIYKANFEGSNYIPFYCTNRNCKEVFLTDNLDIMELCKFKTKKDKEEFYNILGTETNSTSELYCSEIVPVSDNYAFAFREPSIYNIIFESAVLEQDFVEKFGDLITLCTYIDSIYYINKETHQLQPVRTNIYQNNMKKTVKSKIINYSKIISTLNSDQYSMILAYIQKITDAGSSLTYQLPEVTCPHCGTVIPAAEQDASNLVFTRHQLVALANL